MPVPNASPDDLAGYAVEYRAPCAWPSPTAPSPATGSRPTAAGEISLTGRPVLTGPMSPPDPDTGPAIVREAPRKGKQQADIVLRRRRARRGRGRPPGRGAERARQLEALSQLQDETPAESEDSTP